MKQEPIRVAHIVGKMVGGGVESFIMNFYQHIDRDKIQFDFIIDSDSTVVPKKEIESLGGRIIEVPPYQHIFKYIRELKKIFKKNSYSIVHSHLNTLSVFPLYCAWSTNVPVRIAHSHSTTNKKEWKKNILKNILRNFSKVFATNYFACSEHAGRWLFGNKAFDEKKVIIIHNAIDTEKFQFNEKIRAEIRAKIKASNKLVIGHVGRFMEQKNHEFLIDVFNEVHKQNKNTILLLIGDGPLEERIKDKVKILGLEESVHFLGIKNNVNEYMQAMDVFAFPSLYEGLGIVLIEAQCSGLKCICSDEVPKEAKVSENLYYNPLNDVVLWKNSILENILPRKNNIKNVIESGYDINSESTKLLEKYIELKEEQI